MSNCKAGELKNRISVQALTETQDSVGDVLETWTTVGTYWAKIEPASGTEKMIAGQLKAEVSHKISMRYPGGFGWNGHGVQPVDVKIEPSMRIQYNSRTFNIVSVLDEEERHYMLVIYAIELPAIV